MQRVPVINKEGYPLMPTKPSRARRWLKNGKAIIWKNKLNVFAIQLTFDADCDTQPVVAGIESRQAIYRAIRWLEIMS